MARPEFKPTPEQRKMVESLSSYGIPQDEICKVVGCSVPTLEKHFRAELDTATTKANAMVAQRLYQMAVAGNPPAATFFWLKTRANWRETTVIAGDKDAPLQTRVVIEVVDGPAKGSE